jgi:hypothetical protein
LPAGGAALAALAWLAWPAVDDGVADDGVGNDCVTDDCAADVIGLVALVSAPAAEPTADWVTLVSVADVSCA